MNTSDKIALVGLVVAILACIGTWIAVPDFRRWVSTHKFPIAVAIAALVVSASLWLFGGETTEQPKPLSPLTGPDTQTSFGDKSPNVQVTGGQANLTIQDQPSTTRKNTAGKSDKK